MAEKLRLGTVIKHLSRYYFFSLHVPSGAIWLREGERWRPLTLRDRVMLLEELQHAYAGTITGYEFSMEGLEMAINRLAGDRPFSDLPLFAIGDNKAGADDGGGGFSSRDGENGGEGER